MEWIPPSFSFRKKQTQWASFLRKMIFMDEGVYNRLPRHEAIFLLVTEGIYPFIEKRGYTWKLSEKELTTSILNILFEMKQGNDVYIGDHQKDYRIEHYENFLQIMETDVLEQFWSYWGQIEDFHQDGYAYRFRFLLQNLVWNSLSLEHSSSIQEYEKEILEQRIFEDMLHRGISKGKDDPYLQDIQQGLGMRNKHTY